MWKAILAGTAALAVVGTSIVYAQSDGATNVRWNPSHEKRMPLSPEDMAAFTDARIAALKAGLQLTVEQEKLWPGFETALRDIVKTRMEHRLARRNEPRPADPVERLRRQAENLTTAGAALTRLVDAQAPLYASLDDAQKQRFQKLSRILSPRHMRVAERGGRENGRDGRGGRHDRDHRGPRGSDGGYRL